MKIKDAGVILDLKIGLPEYSSLNVGCNLKATLEPGETVKDVVRKLFTEASMQLGKELDKWADVPNLITQMRRSPKAVK